MQRYLPSTFGYRYFSSPFVASAVSEFADDMDLASSFPMFYRYDESRTSSGWVPYTTGTSLLNPMKDMQSTSDQLMFQVPLMLQARSATAIFLSRFTS
jgi:hypothetical protein